MIIILLLYMLGRTHIVVGLFFPLLFMSLFPVIHPFQFLFLSLLGALLPDIDRSSSTIGRKFSFVSWFFKHRGFFHSVYAMIIFSTIIYYFTNSLYVAAFLIGFLSHLLLDSFTKKGISFFVVDKRLKGVFSSGGLFDSFLHSLFLILDLVLIAIILL